MSKEVMMQEVQFIVAITMEADATLTPEQLQEKFKRVSLVDVQGNELKGEVKVLHVKEEAEIYNLEENKVCFVGSEEEIKNLNLLLEFADNKLPKRI